MQARLAAALPNIAAASDVLGIRVQTLPAITAGPEAPALPPSTFPVISAVTDETDETDETDGSKSILLAGAGAAVLIALLGTLALLRQRSVEERRKVRAEPHADYVSL